MSREEAMVEFLGTFTTLSSPPSSLEDLSDGVVLFEALSEIAPDFFDPTTIAHNLGDNWVLKASNVRKLLRNLQSYLREELSKEFTDMDNLPVNAVTREKDTTVIAELVELVAAAAVSCEAKSTYIQRIMQELSPDSQAHMKDVLQTSLTKLSDYQHDGPDEDEDDEGDELVFDQSNQGTAFGGEDHLHKLDEAQREIAQLKAQLEASNEDSSKAQTKLQAMIEDLQDRLISRQNELIQAEEDLQKTTAELEESKSQVHDLEATKAQLADDLDVANAKAQQLHKAEATVLAYKKRLDGHANVTQQRADLEEQSNRYLAQINSLEAEVKKRDTLTKRVTELTAERDHLQQKLASQDGASADASKQLQTLREQLAAAEAAKRLFEEELGELKAQHEAVVESQQHGGASAAQIEALEAEKQSLQEQVAKLQQSVARDTPELAPANTEETMNLKAELEELKLQLEESKKENTKISSDKDKLEAYTKRTLSKFQDKYLVALQECKAKLKEKQDKIEALESRSQSERSAQKREERLLSSTIYELGYSIMQSKLKER